MGGMSTDWGSSGSYDWSDSSSVTKKSARDYAREDRRKYTPDSKKGIAPPNGLELKVQAPASMILVVDVTGSMKEWPKMIFEKIATLYNEANLAMQGVSLEKAKAVKKVDSLLEMAVIAVGDAKYDMYPLQVVDFCKGADLVKGVDKILGEGGGGPFGCESYELAAYYLLNHCKVQKGVKPVCIFACDEEFYKDVDREEVKGIVGSDISSG